MYGNEASIRLSPGISTPSNRGISNFRAQPCLCLCRGFLQTTRTTFFLLIILQLSQNRFTEGRTFIRFNPSRDKKTRPEKIPSQERSHYNNLTFAGRLFGLSSSRRETSLP